MNTSNDSSKSNIARLPIRCAMFIAKIATIIFVVVEYYSLSEGAATSPTGTTLAYVVLLVITPFFFVLAAFVGFLLGTIMKGCLT